LAYEKYDLIKRVIDYGLFDKININYYIPECKKYTEKQNILMFSCSYSKNLSSNEIVKILLKHPTIDINLQNNSGLSSLMYASKFSNTSSTEETVKILLEHPNIDINLQDFTDTTALIYASRTTNINSTEKTVKMLLDHPNINVNLRDFTGSHALLHALRFTNIESTEKTVKMLLEHQKTDINLENKKGHTALFLSICDCKKYPQKMEKIWKLLAKYKIKHNMFYLYKKKKNSSNKEYIDSLKEYMKFERFNLINHRRFYRNQILNKGY
jgi:hypothetical protein